MQTNDGQPDEKTIRQYQHFKMSLQFYPNSIPLLVYNYRLEQDLTKKKELLEELKKKYSKHWMVKRLIESSSIQRV